MTEQTLAQQLAAFSIAAFTDGIPADVEHSVRQRILDVIGLCLAARSLPTSEAALAFVRDEGGREDATIIGEAGRYPAAQAAFANGVLAHSLDYDDTHLPSILHPSASIVPAGLAAAQANGSTGTQLVRAIAVGLEISVRLGMAGYDEDMGNSVFFEHGQHATSICGAMGSAATAVLLYGGTAEDVCNALGVTASMAAGIIEANRTGGTVKRLHCGMAAKSAVTAADLVRRGFTGPPTVLEGRFGFFEAFLHGQFQPEYISEGLGTEWSIPDIFFKPYPANHFTHTSIDAGIAMREQGITPDDIAEVVLGVPTAVIRTIGQPIEGKRTPETGYQAQFSGPYAFTAGLFGGGGLGVGLDDFTDELAQDPARRAVMATVSVEPAAECDEIYPAQFPAVVRVKTKDGRELVEKRLANVGGNKLPLTDDQLSLKFMDNATRVLPEDTCRDIAARTLALSGANELDPIMALTVH